MALLRRPLLMLVALVAIVAAVLLAGRAWLLRDTTEPVDVGGVLDRAGTAGGARVHAYDTTGFEEASVLGTARHDYPATTTITIAPGGCGRTLLWEALDRRSERWTICDGAPVRLDDVHAFFGRTDRRTYRCRDDAAAYACEREGTTRTDRVRDLGRAAVTVAGRRVAGRRLRIETTMRGETRGRGTIDLWLGAGGLPLRVIAANASETDTPIGTAARYRERFELRLRSRQPLGG